MKKCVWVRPELVAQVEFVEWTRMDTCGIPHLLVYATTKTRIRSCGKEPSASGTGPLLDSSLVAIVWFLLLIACLLIGAAFSWLAVGSLREGDYALGVTSATISLIAAATVYILG
jgi:hypothetical protein